VAGNEFIVTEREWGKKNKQVVKTKQKKASRKPTWSRNGRGKRRRKKDVFFSLEQVAAKGQGGEWLGKVKY